MNDIFSKHEIQEYLYLDRRRLNSYVGQFSRLASFLPIFKSKKSFTLVCPGVEVRQELHPVGLAEQNKVVMLVQKLRKTRRLTNLESARGFGAAVDEHEFLLGEMPARRVVLPGRGASAEHGGSVGIWISAGLADRFRLVLVEDYPRSERRGVKHISSCTLLEMLILEMKRRLRRTVLPKLETIQSDAGHELYQNMGRDPFKTFAHLGCHIGHERNIGFLARKRATFHERWIEDTPDLLKDWTIFGYPIAIVESKKRVEQETQAEVQNPVQPSNAANHR